MESQRVNYREVIRRIWAHRRVYILPLVLMTIFVSVIVFSLPRYYTCNLKLAPEYDLSSMGAINSLASTFGLDMGSSPTTDAISPTLYPDLMESTSFIVSLFDIKVQTKDGSVSANYYDYLTKHQKEPFWSSVESWVKSLFASGKAEPTTLNPKALTKKQSDVVNAIVGNVKCKVDKKTDVITLVVTDQDPKVCVTLADSIRVRLQKFITDYRTNKARTDMLYYEKLLKSARAEYEEARDEYAKFCDANFDVTLQYVRSKQESMENDMQQKYNTCTTLQTQYMTAKAKVQQRTPAFTILQDATMPIKPAGPKRMITIIATFFLTIIAVSVYVLRDILLPDEK